SMIPASAPAPPARADRRVTARAFDCGVSGRLESFHSRRSTTSPTTSCSDMLLLLLLNAFGVAYRGFPVWFGCYELQPCIPHLAPSARRGTLRDCMRWLRVERRAWRPCSDRVPGALAHNRTNCCHGLVGAA